MWTIRSRFGARPIAAKVVRLQYGLFRPPSANPTFAGATVLLLGSTVMKIMDTEDMRLLRRWPQRFPAEIRVVGFHWTSRIKLTSNWWWRFLNFVKSGPSAFIWNFNARLGGPRFLQGIAACSLLGFYMESQRVVLGWSLKVEFVKSALLFKETKISQRGKFVWRRRGSMVELLASV